MTVYGEREYRAARAVIRTNNYPCWYGCGRRAVTPDHVPPLAAHQHVAGSGCCALRPACAACNTAAGAALGNRRRARLGLAPGSGWS